MEEHIRAFLLSQTAVTDIAGNKVNFGEHPQGLPLPAIVLNTISDAQGMTLSGPDGLGDAVLQVDCYALDYRAAKLLARAVRAALTGYSSTVVQGTIEIGLRDGYLGDTQDGERPFRVSADFQVLHNI